MRSVFSPATALRSALQQLYMEPEVRSLTTISGCGFILFLANQLEKKVDKLVNILSSQHSLKEKTLSFQKYFLL